MDTNGEEPPLFEWDGHLTYNFSWSLIFIWRNVNQMSKEAHIRRVYDRADKNMLANSGFRAKMLPPYAYTPLCPVPEYRQVKRRKKEHDRTDH